ncbi:hypothetical protein ACIPSA_18190 [Streptomyces sp. NPDC086549]|uniref:hypothetical protein n=1 Tax=Streptomyces sp. NPDC086549 TaxID=3365752 RepID=UPI0038255D08
MNRPSRPARVLASALAAGALLATASCSDGGGSPEAAEVTPAAERPPSPSATAALTGPGAKAALITAADIESPWTEVNNAATWRNQLLVGKVDVAQFLSGKASAADCQKLLDGMYSDTLLGRATGASALTGFTANDYRLLYQVGDYGKDSLTKSLDWMKTLPQKCAQFTAKASDGSERTVQVIELRLPKAGDAVQGLTVTVQGTADGQPVTLTQDVAALRVGASGATVTNGGPSGADHPSTVSAVEAGARRLQDVLAGKTPTANPSQFD